MVGTSELRTELLAAAFEAAAAMVVVDASGIVVHANAAAIDLLAAHARTLDDTPFDNQIAALSDIEATYSPLGSINSKPDAEHTPDYQVVVLRDVGQQRAATTNLIVARKMEALGEMAGSIAHEFNNHLSGASGFAQLAQTSENDQKRLEDCLTEVIAATEAGAKLVSRIMVFGRKQSREQEAVTIAPHILDAAHLISPMLDEDVALSFVVDADESGRIQASPGEITEVLLNLTDNAAQACKQAGASPAEIKQAGASPAEIKLAGASPAEIVISLTRVDLAADQARILADAAPGRYLAIAVADNGCGMTPEVRERMFDPFFTTRDVGDGEGLGLALVYTVVARAQGRVDVTSAPMAGTTITLYFPLVA
mgnify:CR=1 FL=1